MGSPKKHGGCCDPKLMPTWQSWAKMRDRCLNSRHPFYADYGGRGITICAQWSDFPVFLADMGLRPEGLTLERINNNQGYNPQNCKWATRKEQGGNKRNNRLLTINGETHHTAEWERLMGFPRDAIADRLRRNWPLSRLLEPIRYKKKTIAATEVRSNDRANA